jgi:hypothetical protein
MPNQFVDKEGMKRNLEAWKKMFGFGNEKQNNTVPYAPVNSNLESLWDISKMEVPSNLEPGYGRRPSPYVMRDEQGPQWGREFLYEPKKAEASPEIEKAAKELARAGEDAGFPKMTTKDEDDLKKLLADYQGKKAKLDLSGLLSLADAWSGSNLVGAYKKPKSQDELDAEAAAIRLKMEEQRENKQLKREQMAQSMALAQERLKDADLRRQLSEQLGFGNLALKQNRQAVGGSNNVSRAEAQTFKLYEQPLFELSQNPAVGVSSPELLNAKIHQIAIKTGQPYSTVLQGMYNEVKGQQQ